MPLYNYLCRTCEEKATQEVGRALLQEEIFEAAVFETSHAIEPKKKELAEARICPRCQGSNTEKTCMGIEFVVLDKLKAYKDRSGCKRAMDLHALRTNDPYGEYRVPGEVEHIENNIRKAGQHNPNAITFPPSEKVGTSPAKPLGPEKTA